MPSEFHASYAGIGAMLRSDFMAAHMVSRAQRVADFARTRAPVYSGNDRDSHRGRYKDSFRVLGTRAGGRKKDRAAGIVLNDAPESVYVEYGVKAHNVTYRDRKGRERTLHVPEMPARHILGEALMAAAGDE